MSQVAILLAKARGTLEEARLLIEAGYADGGADRCYYAAFYAASALLAERGMEFASHRAVLAAFGKELVRGGTVPAKYHRVLMDAFDLRLTADYDVKARIPIQTAREGYESAKAFVQMAEAKLGPRPDRPR